MCLSRAAKYNYVTDTWISLPDMNAGRWYPTTTALTNGDVLTISGDIDTTAGVNPLPQVMQVKIGTWRNLTSAQITLDDYPRMFLAPNGKVFLAGMGGQPAIWIRREPAPGASSGLGSADFRATGRQ